MRNSRSAMAPSCPAPHPPPQPSPRRLSSHVRFPPEAVGCRGRTVEACTQRIRLPRAVPHPRSDSPIGRLEIESDGKAITGLTIERGGSLPWDDVPERSTPVLEAGREAAQGVLRRQAQGLRPARRALRAPPFQKAVWAADRPARVRRGRLLRRARRRHRAGDRRPRGRRRGRRESGPDHRAVPPRAGRQPAASPATAAARASRRSPGCSLTRASRTPPERRPPETIGSVADPR